MPVCRWKIRRDSSWFVIMFVADICLFYLIPLLLSVVLYSLIAKVMLSKERKLNAQSGGGQSSMTAYRSRHHTAAGGGGGGGAAGTAGDGGRRSITGTNSVTTSVASRDQSRVQVRH